MAIRGWAPDVFDRVADDMEFVATRLRKAAFDMRQKSLTEVMLNADSAFGIYRETLLSLVTRIESEILKQAEALFSNEEPTWKKNVRKAAERRARREASQQANVKGIVKAAKKKHAKKPHSP